MDHPWFASINNSISFPTTFLIDLILLMSISASPPTLTFIILNPLFFNINASFDIFSIESRLTVKSVYIFFLTLPPRYLYNGLPIFFELAS